MEVYANECNGACMDLSIILINHNTKDLTGQTVQSVLNTVHDVDYEMIVMDNSSDPEQQFSCAHARVRVLAGIPNHGFSHACNLGAEQAQGEYLLFLNSDTILRDGTIDRAFAYLRCHEDIGALGVRQLLPDGTLDHGCKRGFPTPMAALYYFTGMDKKHPESHKYGAYRQTFVDEFSIADVDCISGAFMLMPRAVFEQTGGFDEDYFMYSEDVDLCYRIRRAGWRIVYYGKASFVHLKGQSGIRDPLVLKHFYVSMRLFYDKHLKQRYHFLVNFLVHRAIDLKYYLAKRKMKRSSERHD